MADMIKANANAVAPQFVNFKSWFKDHLLKTAKNKEFRTVHQKWADPSDHSKGRVECDPYRTLRFCDAKNNFLDENGKVAKANEELIIKVAKATQKSQGMGGEDFTWDWVKDNMNNLVIGKVTSEQGNTSWVLALSTAEVSAIDTSDFD